ncbi:DUF4235 domain-containing protein [Neomicrococcus aestuarii]|uniref:DUF4235 domain-containing protein n=1 Tax=Neomicrococcus aestuarii TaxID=556325 RepID=A0A1L2ZQA2_9MICC|nr:DUF4235 domain-containing protein [Neomicrococcus aestuarii]APF41347.1 hypothetical protein BHE16_10485 [Neomicrococcus aestuarii]
MNVVLKVGASLASIAAGFLGKKIVDIVWKKSTGKESPNMMDADAQREQSLKQVLAFTVFSSIVMGVIQVLTNRGTQRALQKYTSNLDEV